MTMYSEEKLPITTLSCEMIDQAALQGVLDTLFTLRLPLLPVDFVELKEF